MSQDATGRRDVIQDDDRAALVRKLTAVRIGHELLTDLVADPCARMDGRRPIRPIIDSLERTVEEITQMLALYDRRA